MGKSTINGHVQWLFWQITRGYINGISIYIYEIWLYMSPEGKYGSNPIFFPYLYCYCRWYIHLVIYEIWFIAIHPMVGIHTEWCIEFIPVKGLMRGSIVMRVPIKIAGWWLFPWENLNPKMDDNWYPHDLGNLHIFWAHSKSPRFHSPWMRLQSRIIVVFQNLPYSLVDIVVPI